MASASQRPRGRDGVLSTLDVIIQGLNLAKDTCGVLPAQAAFGSVSALLTMIRVCSPCHNVMSSWLTFFQDFVANKQDYVDLGISCADVCKVLNRGLEGRRLDELSQSVLGAIEQLTTSVELAMYVSSVPLTTVSITGQWPRFRGRSSTRVNDMWSFESFVRSPTKIRLRLGGKTSTGSFTFSTYVQ